MIYLPKPLPSHKKGSGWLFVSCLFVCVVANGDFYKLGIVTSQQDISFTLWSILPMYVDVLPVINILLPIFSLF